MKILIVNKFLYPNGGSETYIFTLGEALKKLGHEVEYFGMEHEGRIVGNRINEYTSNMDFHTGKLAKLMYPFRIIYSKEAYGKITKVLDDFKPDVVHLNNFNFQLTPSVIYAVRDWEKKTGNTVKLVYTAHDLQWVCPNHMMRIPATGELCDQCNCGDYGNCIKNKCLHNSTVKSILAAYEGKHYYKKRTYELVDTIIAPSEFLADKLRKYRGLSDRIIAMHNFTDIKYEGQPDQNENDYVFYFGRYSEEKGVDTLLKVCGEFPETRFKFAGGGPLEDRVNEAANVENLGFLKGEALYREIAGAKLVVFPSIWYENCPMSVMESICLNTPVLASNIGGVPELVEDGVTGELFRAGDADDLARKLKALLDDNKKLKEYSDNCASVSFDTPEEYTRKFIELIG